MQMYRLVPVTKRGNWTGTTILDKKWLKSYSIYLSFPVAEHSTNYRADTEALKQEAILVKDFLEPCSPTIFLTDALSVLEALQTKNSAATHAE